MSIAPAGWELFARFAFPPNELGYCGPPDASVLLRGAARHEIADHAAGFDGAWPYLEEIAAAIGAGDPLEDEVVRTLRARLPAAVRDALNARWGPPEADPTLRQRRFTIAGWRAGNVFVGIQPSRSRTSIRGGRIAFASAAVR